MGVTVNSEILENVLEGTSRGGTRRALQGELSQDRFLMSQWDTKALETNFEGWRRERVPELSVADAFERYVVEAVFKSHDLSDEEISYGMLGGGNDGGVDGAYFFVNKKLMTEDSELPNKAISAELWFIQAKNENGFSEAPILKFKSFFEDMFDFEKDVSTFPIYSTRVKEFISLFRENLGNIIGALADAKVFFVYASKSDHEPSSGVKHRAEVLKAVVPKYVSAFSVEFVYIGARDLLESWRKQPVKTHSLEVVNQFTQGGSFIGISRLDRFGAFLTDEKGELRQGFLEPNVRDYNGATNKVNQDIRSTLLAGANEEFWWLNNGITILAEDCNFAAGKLNITTPEIVNGLQTCHEIYNFFRSHKVEDKRLVLIRVILPPNDSVRRRIIKATNSQTPVNPISLHANDDIHFEIEELFRLNNLYYDRRKGEHRRKLRQVSSIVSMADVAQAVIAIALGSPNTARARPGKYLGSEDRYAEIFDTGANRNVFLTCILIDRSVKKYLSSLEDVGKDEKTDVRFYVGTWVAFMLCKKAQPNKNDLAALAATLKNTLAEAAIGDAYRAIREIYIAQGGNDKAAKSSAMTDKVLAALRERLK